MISLITVVFDHLKPFLDIFFESVIHKTKLINEVILPAPDKKDDFLETWVERDIKFIKFGSKQKVFNVGSPASICLDHAFNLHAGIDRASNDFVLMSDPDLFFYSNIDEFYMNLVNEYNLNYIGVSHPAAITQSFTYFPNILNCIGRKSQFPDKEFLKDQLVLDQIFPSECAGNKTAVPGKFLATGPLPGTSHLFPKPDGHYETGCNMVLWAKEKNWNWLSFQTADTHLYTSRYCRGTVKVKKLPNQKLIYHATNGSTKTHTLENFIKEYNLSKEENDND